jgi:pimeloyl-ACP methyl ester carboxylesterase
MAEPGTLWNELLGCEVVYRDADGIRTRCLERGDGPLLFLLHGTGGHVEAWARNISYLSRHFRVIAFDMVGHGLSSKPDALEYVIPDYTRHIRALMAGMAVSRAHFVGLSLGAWVATWLCLETPEYVDRLVNCTGGVFRWPEGQEAAEARQRSAMVKANDDLATLSRATVRQRLHSLFHDPRLCPEELVDLRLALYTQPGVPELLPKLHNMVPYDSPVRRKFALTPELLSQIPAPVLYLWGEFNSGGSVGSARRAAAFTPVAELAIIPDAGHWPQWERPGDFNQHVTEFLMRPRLEDGR